MEIILLDNNNVEEYYRILSTLSFLHRNVRLRHQDEHIVSNHLHYRELKTCLCSQIPSIELLAHKLYTPNGDR